MKSFAGAATVPGLLVITTWACTSVHRDGTEGRDRRGTLEPALTVRALLGAIDRGNVDAVMSLLAPGFRLRTWDGEPVADRQGYRAILGWDLAASGHRRVERFDVEGNAVTMRVTERNRFTALLGLAPFDMDIRYVVREGRIVEQFLRERTEAGSRSYTDRFSAALEPVLAWAEIETPDLWARATDEGVIRYDGASAEALLELIRRYCARPEEV